NGERAEQRPEGVRDALRPLPGGEGPEDDHHREQGEDQQERVLVEDQGDHVADGGQLDERADHRDADVLLEAGVPRARCDRGHRDEGECRSHLLDGDVDRGGGEHHQVASSAVASSGSAISSISSAAGPCATTRPPSIRTTWSASRLACAMSWVTTTSEIAVLARRRRSVPSTALRAAWSNAEVGSSSRRTPASSATARASITPCPPPTESLEAPRPTD